MQTSKNRPYQDRPKRKKQTRPPQDSAAPYPSSDPRPKGRQPRYNRRDDHDTYYPRNAQPDGVFVYRQDLLQKGFDVFATNKSSAKYNELCDRFPECFNTAKRKVVIDTADPAYDDPSFSQSRIQMKDDLREDLGHLIDNEEIPDWFLDAPATQTAKPVLFDFGTTVSRTLQVNKEKAKRIDSNPVTLNPRPAELEEINFEELDNKLEANYIKSKVLAASEDEDEVFDLDLDRPFGDGHHDVPAADHGPKEPVSMNESSDCFNDLEHHIKKMLFKEKQSGSEAGEDSEESFNESLGFETNRETQVGKMIDPSTRNQTPASVLTPLHPEHHLPAPAPVPQSSLSLIQDLQSAIRPVESYLIPPNVMSVNRALCNSLNNSMTEPDAQLKEAIDNDETLKLTPAEKAARQAAFMDKYGYLDPIMNQLCYEILNSKRRSQINSYSANGFNQKSVEKYCGNKYKIFSLFLQGNIVEKVWHYKDKLGMVHGPFMSYDMDIWNGENNFFSEDLLVSLDNSPFLNIKLWVHRSSVVMKLVDEFMRRKESMPVQAPPAFTRAHTTGAQPTGGHPLPQGHGRHPPRDGHAHHGHHKGSQNLHHSAADNSKYDKKVSFHKKNENDQAGGHAAHNTPAASHAPEPAVRAKPAEELQKNYNQMFPELDESDKVEPKHANRVKKASQPVAGTTPAQPPQGAQPVPTPQAPASVQPAPQATPAQLTKSAELHLLEALKGAPSKAEETTEARRSDKGPSAKGTEPAPVLAAPKKEDKAPAPTKKEPEQEAQADAKKRGKTEPERTETRKTAPAPMNSARQQKKGGNPPAPKKDDGHVYVAKEATQDESKRQPEKPPVKAEEPRINQEGTASIKNLLGLSW